MLVKVRSLPEKSHIGGLVHIYKVYVQAIAYRVLVKPCILFKIKISTLCLNLITYIMVDFC
jgi:hypothetical protein